MTSIARSIAVAAGGLVALGAHEAAAGPIGFDLRVASISGSVSPTFFLTNQSATAQITDFSVTIGDTAFNFDAVLAQQFDVGTGGFTLNTPDTNFNGGVRSDTVDYDYTGFDPSEVFRFTTDIDIDNANTTELFRSVLFNNGDAANALVTVGFLEDGAAAEAQLTLPDAPFRTAYDFSVRDTIGAPPPPPGNEVPGSDVPAPATLTLLGLGLAGLGWARRRKPRSV